MSTKAVVILSGPVGAGKSTVARELLAISPGPVACIEGDVFWTFLAKGGTSRENFKTIMRAMTVAAMPFARAGHEIIVDFSIPPWFLDSVRKLIQTREIPLDYVVLRPSEAVCADRAAKRAEGTIPDYSTYRELYADFDGVERHTVAGDVSDAASLAALIRQGLDAGRFRVEPVRV